MARLIVDAMFGSSDEQMPDSGGRSAPLLSATESRVLIQIIGGGLTAAADEVFGPVFGGRVINLLQNIDHASLIDDALGSEGLILFAEASGMIKEQRGDFALGLPFSLMEQLQSRESAVDIDSGDGQSSRNVGSLAAVTIELRAVLAERELSLAEVRRLKLGAVIVLQRLRHLPKAQLCAAGQVLFRGTIIEHQGWHNFLIQQVESADVERAA
jgi:flagellar motor switch protein FliM